MAGFFTERGCEERNSGRQKVKRMPGLKAGKKDLEVSMTEKQKIRLEMEKERIRGMREFENGLVREALGTN